MLFTTKRSHGTSMVENRCLKCIYICILSPIS